MRHRVYRHWQLTLSPTKCTAMHLSPAQSVIKPLNYCYCIGDVDLPFIDTCTDLGVTYNRSLNYAAHINNIAAKASLRVKLVLKCFQTRDAAVLMKAFVTFVCSILEYASAVWNPHYKCEIEKVELVQRRFTNKHAGYRKLSYEHRLARLNIDSMQVRRMRADLI